MQKAQEGERCAPVSPVAFHVKFPPPRKGVRSLRAKALVAHKGQRCRRSIYIHQQEQGGEHMVNHQLGKTV